MKTKQVVTVGAVVLALVTGASTEVGKNIVTSARDWLLPPQASAPTLGNEVRVIVPPNMPVGEVYITRPVTGTHVEIQTAALQD